MIQPVLAARRGVGEVLATTPTNAAWWLAGGIDPAACVAAYQPKGAASYAASKVNLANPGTYDAVEGVAPAWDVATGWTFNGIAQYLDSGVNPNNGTWSMICQFTDGVAGINRYVMGINFGVQRFWLGPLRVGSVTHSFGYGNSIATPAPAYPSGNFALAGQSNAPAYINGAFDAIVEGAWQATALTIFLGAANVSIGAGNFWNGAIQASAIYNVTLTPEQVAAIAARMAAI